MANALNDNAADLSDAAGCAALLDNGFSPDEVGLHLAAAIDIARGLRQSDRER